MIPYTYIHKSDTCIHHTKDHQSSSLILQLHTYVHGNILTNITEMDREMKRE